MSSQVQPVAQDSYRAVVWTAAIAALIYALLFERLEWGGSAGYVLAVLPTVLVYLVSRSMLSAAVMFLLPIYFVIGQATASAQHYQPFTPLDHAMPLSPPWVFVYSSLYMCAFLLPMVVVRGNELVRQTLKAYLFVMLVSYAGFWSYPTVAPRIETATGRGFSEWMLRLFYDIDQPYGCFPSLHVAYSFVAAFACLRMHRRLGIAAIGWSVLIAVATVYTKQHFVVDAVAGACLALGAYLLFLRGRPREAITDADHKAAPRRALYVAAAYLVAIGLFWTAYRVGT